MPDTTSTGAPSTGARSESLFTPPSRSGTGSTGGVATAARPLTVRVQPSLATQVRWVAASEWTKLRSVRSTVFSILATMLVVIGLGGLFAWGTVARWDRLDPGERANFDPTGRSLGGIFLGQLVIGVLGVLVLSAEYSTGTIRATLGATPQRGLVLVVKSVVFAVVAFVISLITCLAAFFLAQSIYATKNASTTLTADGVPKLILGGALYLTLVALMGIGLAALLRHTAGAISTLFGLLLVLTILSNFLPSDWQAHVNQYLPLNAGQVLFSAHPDAGSLSWGGALALLCGYALALLVAGYAVIKTRDA